MDKKTKTILIVLAVVVVIIALFIPYTEKEKEAQKLKAFACSDVSENQENDTKLNKISCSKYQEITQGEEKSLILIARPTCGFCTKFIPVLEEIVEEYGIAVNYFDTDALSDEEVTSFYTSADLFQSKQFGTPTLMITKNSKIIEYRIGYMEKDVAISWLKDVGIINE